ncbi:MAG: lysophospholipase L1-like esterase [Gammaproteobacteria bacterium]|jgi:lysophospholipase L1-like esterase
MYFITSKINMMRSTTSVLLLALFVSAVVVLAQEQDPEPARFSAEIDSFVSWDKKNNFPKDAIVFVGSSSIKYWLTSNAFPNLSIINRGFGGSHISDVNFYYDLVVKPYSPSTIVFYAGDNDIAAGKSPQRVLADFKSFVDRVRVDSELTKILFISIKPSKSRWHIWPEMVDANKLIMEYISEQTSIIYVDLASPLLDNKGQPMDVYVDDDLHLNSYGYQLWNEVLRSYLN